jgi:hypothetical protein
MDESCPSIGALLQQVFGVFDGDGEVGAAEVAEDGEIYADDFSVAVEERAAGAAGGGGGVVNNLVVEDVAYVALVVVGRMRCWEASCAMMRLTSWVSLPLMIFWDTSLPALARMPSIPVG